MVENTHAGTHMADCQNHGAWNRPSSIIVSPIVFRSFCHCEHKWTVCACSSIRQHKYASRIKLSRIIVGVCFILKLKRQRSIGTVGCALQNIRKCYLGALFGHRSGHRLEYRTFQKYIAWSCGTNDRSNPTYVLLMNNCSTNAGIQTNLNTQTDPVHIQHIPFYVLLNWGIVL